MSISRAGVRDLRQNLSKYLDRVRAGESFEVTEHGRPVARLVPLELDPLSELEHEGRVTVRHATGSIADLGRPPERAPGQPALSDVLAELRGDERF